VILHLFESLAARKEWRYGDDEAFKIKAVVSGKLKGNMTSRL
jgi:hypothetical protein